MCAIQVSLEGKKATLHWPPSLMPHEKAIQTLQLGWKEESSKETGRSIFFV